MTAPLTVSAKPERISDLMRHLMETAADEESVTIGHILHVFGVRGFAFLLLVLALLNIVIFMVPFLSVLFGLPMVILAAQMVLGLHAPIFPRFVRQRTISRQALHKGLEQAIYWVEQLERFIRPRGMFLSEQRFMRFHGLLALVLAVMVTLPIPVVNIPPSIGLVFLALGILERDGIFILAAYIIGCWCFLLFKSLGHVVHSVTHG